ncbi:MAG: flavodoxin domain-containing protein [Clostridia bacterium]|jgi:flavodoxin|nr:hypothetical protein [Clostridia bacterium]HPB17247.1 flavodoxin domain-containing protein [Clostridia bacterium]HQM95628.1 flavodoxin domain-containing protein [Clostridia bacterium]HQO69155.1 flavodoxin domain-containing protein [Clostridia bacterium]
MSKVSIVYATMTKHSKKLAMAIAEELGIEAVNVSEESKPEKADLLFIVGGIYGGACNPVLVAFVNKLDKDMVGKTVLVTSSASESGRCQKQLRDILTEKEIPLIDEITCPGGILFVRLGHPNKKEIQQVAKKAKSIYAQESVTEL